MIKYRTLIKNIETYELQGNTPGMFKEILLFLWETIWFDNLYYEGPTEIIINDNEITITNNDRIPFVQTRNPDLSKEGERNHPIVEREIIIIDRIDSILNIPYELHYANDFQYSAIVYGFIDRYADYYDFFSGM